MSYTDPCTIALKFDKMLEEIQDMQGEIYDMEQLYDEVFYDETIVEKFDDETAKLLKEF